MQNCTLFVFYWSIQLGVRLQLENLNKFYSILYIIIFAPKKNDAISKQCSEAFTTGNLNRKSVNLRLESYSQLLPSATANPFSFLTST